jgi:hypothetical protein
MADRARPLNTVGMVSHGPGGQRSHRSVILRPHCAVMLLFTYQSNTAVQYDERLGVNPYRGRHLCSYSRTSQHLMESEGSLPHSQEPATAPYPQPLQSSPYYSFRFNTFTCYERHVSEAAFSRQRIRSSVGNRLVKRISAEEHRGNC